MGELIRKYYKKGNVKYEYWLNNGTIHKLNYPGEIWYYENGNKKSEYWYVDGFKHNLKGPAEIYYYENGNIKSEHWYVNGIKIEKPFDNYPLTTEQIIEMKLMYG